VQPKQWKLWKKEEARARTRTWSLITAAWSSWCILSIAHGHRHGHGSALALALVQSLNVSQGFSCNIAFAPLAIYAHSTSILHTYKITVKTIKLQSSIFFFFVLLTFYVFNFLSLAHRREQRLRDTTLQGKVDIVQRTTTKRRPQAFVSFWKRFLEFYSFFFWLNFCLRVFCWWFFMLFLNCCCCCCCCVYCMVWAKREPPLPLLLHLYHTLHTHTL